MLQPQLNGFCYQFRPGSERSLEELARRLSSMIAPMQVMLDDRADTYQAIWRHIPLGPADLNFFMISDSQLVVHTPAAAPSFELLYLHQGEMELLHSGRRVVLPEGSLVLVDNREAWEFEFPARSSCLTMHLEGPWLKRWLACPERLVAQPDHRDSSWGRPLAAALIAIHDEGEQWRTGVPGPVVAESLGGLIALLLSARDGTPADTRYQMNLHLAVERLLYERFEQPGLKAAEVADELGISQRHLHNICSKAGKSFATMLLDIRLERARLMLEEERYRAYRICEIAWACGFADPGHFARRFRERNGVVPGRYRQYAAARLSVAESLATRLRRVS